LHQWVQQKELNDKNEQSVVIIILVATLFFRHFLRIIMAYNKTSEERKRQAKKLYFLFI